MNDLWMKIKAWTKGIVFGAILLYSVLFIYNNSGKPVDFWWWFHHTHDTTVFLLVLFAFCGGVLTDIIVRTLWSTYRQIRQSRVRSRTDRLEREMADMQAKAAMLQTRPAAGAVGAENVTVHVDKLGGAS